jgi:hypothetical protein
MSNIEEKSHKQLLSTLPQALFDQIDVQKIMKIKGIMIVGKKII